MRIREHIHAFVREIWQWYAANKRTLPWRDLVMGDENERAYHILVSEVMLQQTQVERVKIVFKEFLDRFPFMRDLAAASNREVLIAWRGMGYNSRALRLRDAAKTIIENFQGKFPQSMEELQQIKGIGHYTAAAIRNFAFGIPTPCIDTNIRRVLHRTFIGVENPDGTWKASDRELLTIAGKVLDAALEPANGFRGTRRARGIRGKSSSDSSVSSLHTTANWHAALMDYGSLVQTKTKPKWDLCPLTKNGLCKAAHALRHAEPLDSARGKLRPSRHGERSRTTKHVATKREPGRIVGTVFIPNRIFRGKIVEELRDAERGLPLIELGKRICLDWKRSDHEKWLKGILAKLESDALIEQRREKYVLKQ